MYTIFGSSDQETAQEQLKMIVSAGRRVIEDLKITNYRSDINKNWQVYIPTLTPVIGLFQKNKAKGGG